MDLRFNSFEECCEHLGISPELPDFSELPEKMRKHLIASIKLQVIVKAHNNEWVADYNNNNQLKYTPWFKYSRGAWSYADFGYGNPGTYVGSLLVYKDWETAKYVAETFIDIYRDWLA